MSRPCPDCGVAVGKAHARGCDVARCLVCGGQRLACGCQAASKDIWTGRHPGEEECERFGFWCVPKGPFGENGFQPVPAGTPGAMHDLNRLAAKTVWNPTTKQLELRVKEKSEPYVPMQLRMEDPPALTVSIDVRKSKVARIEIRANGELLYTILGSDLHLEPGVGVGPIRPGVIRVHSPGDCTFDPVWDTFNKASKP